MYEWTKNITDITDYVREPDTLKEKGVDITNRLPREMIYNAGNE